MAAAEEAVFTRKVEFETVLDIFLFMPHGADIELNVVGIHEVTSPQAFDGLRVAGRQVRQVSKTFGTMDHSISTQVRDVNKLEGQAKIQILELAKNTKATGIQLFDMTTKEQGIVHVSREIGRASCRERV